MERVSDKWIDEAISYQKRFSRSYERNVLKALIELRERREKDSLLIAATKELTQAMNDLRDRRAEEKEREKA